MSSEGRSSISKFFPTYSNRGGGIRKDNGRFRLTKEFVSPQRPKQYWPPIL